MELERKVSFLLKISLSAVHQWKDTNAVINCFKNIQNKRKCIFMQFDIDQFYPSIPNELLQKAINHTSTFVKMNIEEINVIRHSRKSLLFNSNHIWIKKDENPNFDATMGSYDWAEICKLVDLYILQVLGEKKIKDKIGLYCDDGLTCFRIKIEKQKKEHNMVQPSLQCQCYHKN